MQMCLQLLKWQASIALTSMHRCLQSWYACLVVHVELFYDKCCLTNLCTFLQIWVLLIIASSELPFNRWARISTDYSLTGQAQLIRKLTVSWQLRSFGRYLQLGGVWFKTQVRGTSWTHTLSNQFHLRELV